MMPLIGQYLFRVLEYSTSVTISTGWPMHLHLDYLLPSLISIDLLLMFVELVCALLDAVC